MGVAHGSLCRGQGGVHSDNELASPTHNHTYHTYHTCHYPPPESAVLGVPATRTGRLTHCCCRPAMHTLRSNWWRALLWAGR